MQSVIDFYIKQFWKYIYKYNSGVCVKAVPRGITSMGSFTFYL